MIHAEIISNIYFYSEHNILLFTYFYSVLNISCTIYVQRIITDRRTKQEKNILYILTTIFTQTQHSNNVFVV